MTSFLSAQGMVVAGTILTMTPDTALNWVRLGFMREVDEPQETKEAPAPKRRGRKPLNPVQETK